MSNKREMAEGQEGHLLDIKAVVWLMKRYEDGWKWRVCHIQSNPEFKSNGVLFAGQHFGIYTMDWTTSFQIHVWNPNPQRDSIWR